MDARKIQRFIVADTEENPNNKFHIDLSNQLKCLRVQDLNLVHSAISIMVPTVIADVVCEYYLGHTQASPSGQALLQPHVDKILCQPQLHMSSDNHYFYMCDGSSKKSFQKCDCIDQYLVPTEEKTNTPGRVFTLRCIPGKRDFIHCAEHIQIDEDSMTFMFTELHYESKTNAKKILCRISVQSHTKDSYDWAKEKIGAILDNPNLEYEGAMNTTHHKQA